MDENKKLQHEKHLVAILIMIIALLIAGIISYFLFNGNNEDKSEPKTNNQTTETTNNTEKKEENTKIEEKETEVSIDKYSYLLNSLYTVCFNDLGNYININKMNNETRITVALGNTESKKIRLNNTDEIDMTGCKKDGDNIVTSQGINLIDFENFETAYSGNDVEKKIKEIYGKNTIVKHQTIGFAFYDKTANAYIVPGAGCGNYGDGVLQEITKITTSKNKLYIYTSVGSYADTSDAATAKICYDYDYNNTKTACISRSKLDKKYLVEDSAFEGSFDTETYMKDNIDKFAKYKYTFEKEDDNYIIKKLEKID